MITLGNYISYAVSPYNSWFKDLGWPDLDIVEFKDGEWAIRQFHSSPVVPCLTRWSWVLTDLRHIIPTLGFVKRQIDSLDLQKREFWAKEEEHQQRIRDEVAYEDRRAEDRTETVMKSIRKNRRLQERIASQGVSALSLKNISDQIPNYRFRR